MSLEAQDRTVVKQQALLSVSNHTCIASQTRMMTSGESGRLTHQGLKTLREGRVGIHHPVWGGGWGSGYKQPLFSL